MMGPTGKQEIHDAFWRGKHEAAREIREVCKARGYNNPEYFEWTAKQTVEWLLSLLSPKT